ncbi:MAG: hypothetical protein PHV68_05710 [Candidatus Gastranaerophilales bacterium]|nr:hypothetical protein [Candidatus Gastranaerophilales bacterium]
MPSFQNEYFNAIFVDNKTVLNTLFDYYSLLKFFKPDYKNFIFYNLPPLFSSKIFNFIVLENKIFFSFARNLDFLKPQLPQVIYPSELLQSSVIKVANEFGLNFCSINVLKTEKGLTIVDISPFPNIETIEKIYKIEIVPALISFISRTGN